MSELRKIVIIGGGASGFFAAMRCAQFARENQLKVDIRIFEASSGFKKALSG